MRTFGRKKTEYFEFKIEGYDEVYRIPLAADMPYTFLNKVNQAAGAGESFVLQVEMLRKHMGDVVDDLTAETLSDILLAWSEESKGAGASVGES